VGDGLLRASTYVLALSGSYETTMCEYANAAPALSTRNARSAATSRRLPRSAFRTVLRAAEAVPAVRRRVFTAPPSRHRPPPGTFAGSARSRPQVPERSCRRDLERVGRHQATGLRPHVRRHGLGAVTVQPVGPGRAAVTSQEWPSAAGPGTYAGWAVRPNEGATSASSCTSACQP
jgi:hypothetical protein